MTAARQDLIHDIVSRAADVAPDRLALIAPDGTATSFAEFERQVRALSLWVAERAPEGGRVAVIADNGADYARLYYAVPRAGRVLVLINQRLGVGERATQLADTKPAVLVGESCFLHEHASVTQVAFDGPEWQRALTHSRGSTAPVQSHDPAWLLFTSGSTGRPKPVLHTHRSITTAVRGTVAGRSVRAGGVYLLPFPMCHIAGYNMLVHHMKQSTVLPVAAFRPAEFVAAVNAYGVTSCSLAPTMLHALLGYLRESDLAMPSLREIAYGSAAMPADLLRRALARLDVEFHQGYGMTETGGNVAFLGPAEHRAAAHGDASALASAGHPHAQVELRVDPFSGEVLIRGAQVAPGSVGEDGWLRTGDVGRFDCAGRLVIVERLKDIIITGGENVSSREVEDVLSGHPDVEEVAVVGVPDDYWGEAVCAVVVARAGSTPTAEQLISHVRIHLAGFKRPRHVIFVEALPLTSNGKVAKAVIRASIRPPASG